MSLCEAQNQDEICYHKHTPCCSYKVSVSSPTSAFCMQEWQKGPRHVDWHKVELTSLSIPVWLVCWFVSLSCHPDINVKYSLELLQHVMQLNPSSHNYTFGCLVKMPGV